MLSKIKCPKCGQSIELSEAVKGEWEEEFKKSQEHKLREEVAKAQKQAEEKALSKLTQDFGDKLKQTIEEAEEERKRNRKLISEIAKFLSVIYFMSP